MAVLVERTRGIAEIALTILCILLAYLTGISSLIIHRKNISWFFFTLISWVCYSLAFYVLGVSFSPQPSLESAACSSLACSALLFVGLANSIVCRIIPDPYRNLCASYQQLAQMVFVLVLILSPWSIGPRRPFGLLLAALFMLWLSQQWSRHLSASARSRTKDDLVISEYMAKSHSHDQEPSPGDLTSSCNYIVAGEVASTMWWVLLLRVLLKPVMNFRMEVQRRGTKSIPDLLGLGAFFHDLQHASSPVIRYDTLVTVEDIWKHIPPSPSGPRSFFHFPGRESAEESVGGRFLDGRDLCLSFALFKLLRRRFRGCNLHESGLRKTREFAMQHLLSDSPPNADSLSDPLKPPSFLQKASSSRSFNIIEAELGFLFDFFYANHYLPDFVCFLSSIVFIGCTTSLIPVYYKELRDEHKTQGIHFIATAAIIFFFFPVLGMVQLLQTFSHWQKVNRLVHSCQRRKRLSLSQGSTSSGVLHRIVGLGLSLSLGLVLLMLSPFRTTFFWKRRLTPFRTTKSDWLHCTAKQYCLLLDGDYHRATTRKIHVKAWEALVNALLDALRHRDGVLSDGQSSLSRNGVHTELSWACRQEYVAEKIIVWHIATTLCNFGYVVQPTRNSCVPSTQTRESEGNKIDEDHEVATVLSGYCAYLVGFAPELIADDIYATRLVFDNARAAASERLKGEGSLKRMSDSARMMTFDSSVIDSAAAAAKLEVVSQGKTLAGQLIKHEKDGVRWRVLAGFWAELMLFISPADNAAAHLEKLKTGDELITRIWALLTHAGILTRPSRQQDQTIHLRDRQDLEKGPVLKCE